MQSRYLPESLGVSLLMFCFFGIWFNGCLIGDSRPCDAANPCGEKYACIRGWCLPPDKFSDRVEDSSARFDTNNTEYLAETKTDTQSITDSCKDKCKDGERKACYTSNTVGCDVTNQTCTGACSFGRQTCQVQANGCNDWSSCKGAKTPGKELCDGDDNDCDGMVDEELKRTCYSGKPSTKDKGVCKAGIQACKNGQWGSCIGEVIPSTPDLCDNQDNDCDGQTDEDCTWVTQILTTLNDEAIINSVAVDDKSQVYVKGAFSGTMRLGSLSIKSKGSSDIFVAKLGPSGSCIWLVRAGGLGDDTGTGVTVDRQGSIYIVGGFSNTADFNTHSLRSKGAEDIFVTKIDSLGKFLWAARAGSTGDDRALNVALDPQGELYITGVFHKNADFGQKNLLSKGNSDIFVAKLDRTGGFLWAVRAGSTGDDRGFGLVGAKDRVSISGYFSSTADFGKITLTSKGGRDIFVAQISPTGTFLWASRAGSKGEDVSHHLVRNKENLFLVGGVTGKADFGIHTTTDFGNLNKSNMFVAKLDQTGRFLWVSEVGSTNSTMGVALAFDSSGNLFATGYFEGGVSFDKVVLVSKGEQDIFLVKIEPSGKFVGAIRAGSKKQDMGIGLGLNALGHLFVVGHFSGTADFGQNSLVSKGKENGFIWRLSSSAL